MANRKPLVLDDAGAKEQLQSGDALVAGIASTYLVYAGTSGELLGSSYMTFDGTRPRFAYGANFGVPTGTYWNGSCIVNYHFQRRGNLSDGTILDYQDELPYLHKWGTSSFSPSPDTGSGDYTTGNCCFLDDTTYAQWSSGSTAGTVVFEILPTTVIPHRSASDGWRLGVTFRSSNSAANPTHIKVEMATTTTGAYATYYDDDVPTIEKYDQFLFPAFSTPSPYTIGKIKITFTIPNPLTAHFRLQRVILYHTGQTWDPWHIHIGGGTLWGNLTLGSRASIVSASSTDLTIEPASGKNIVLDGVKWPTADGAAGSILRTNGSATLSWTNNPRLYEVYNSTTDDTVTELFTDGSSGRITIAESTTWYATIKWIARQTNGDYTVGGGHWEGIFTRDSGGNVSITNSDTLESFLNDMGWSFSVSADTTNQSIKCSVQGVSSENISWRATVELVKVPV